MKKDEAIKIFGTVTELAEALGVTRHAIYQWPDDLPQATHDRVIGAAVRVGIQGLADSVQKSGQSGAA